MITEMVLIFEIGNFPFLDGYVPRAPSNAVYVSQLIHFARICSNVMIVTTETNF